jgi:hypothetical protein
LVVAVLVEITAYITVLLELQTLVAAAAEAVIAAAGLIILALAVLAW